MLPLIVSGPPGAGKTSVANALAQRDKMGVHIETDAFFDFVSKPVDPSTTEAAAQNETVVQAYCRAASEYQRGGYNVFMDGVIGPWLFPLILPILTSFDFVILDVELSRAHDRNHGRRDVISAGIIERMYFQFEAAKRAFPQHVIETNAIDIEEATRLITDARGGGRLAVTSSSI